MFPDTPPLDEACHRNEFGAACTAEGLGASSTEAVGTPLPIALGHLTADQEGQLREVLDRFPTLFSRNKQAVGHIPGVQYCIVTTQDTRLCATVEACTENEGSSMHGV